MKINTTVPLLLSEKEWVNFFDNFEGQKIKNGMNAYPFVPFENFLSIRNVSLDPNVLNFVSGSNLKS